LDIQDLLDILDLLDIGDLKVMLVTGDLLDQ